MNKVASILLFSFYFCSCSSPTVRTKFTSPDHQIMVSPENLTEQAYLSIQSALVESNKFYVVDRARGFKAVQAEQNMVHGENTHRFDDSEKYSRAGKLYGVGAVIVASEKCVNVPGIIAYVKRIDCRQNLSAIDTSTGEVITAIENIAEGQNSYENPGWADTVEKFNRAFPKTWEPKQYDKKMVEFRKENASGAKQSSEIIMREPASLQEEK